MDGYPYFPLKTARRGSASLVASPASGESWELNKDGSALAALCDGRRSLDEIVERVAFETGLDANLVRPRTEAAMAMLTAQGMLWWRRSKERWSPAPRPRLFYWDITLKCNLHCAHCVVRAGESLPSELSTAECMGVLDQVAAYGASGVVFSGGEPLMRPDVLQLAARARDLGLSVQMATNGTLVTSALARAIADLGIDVQVSVDGPTAEVHDRFRGRPGAFDLTLAGIARLREAGASFMIGTVLHRGNLTEIRSMYELGIRLGAHTFRPIPFIASGRGKDNAGLEPSPEEFRAATEEIRSLRASGPIPIVDQQFECSFSAQPGTSAEPGGRFGCTGASPDFSITADGDVLPCSFFEGVQAHNLRERPFAWIWENSPVLVYFRDIRADDVRGPCRSCEWFSACLGGCPAANFARGRMLESHIQCWVASSAQTAHR